jgi:hypothetical protein
MFKKKKRAMLVVATHDRKIGSWISATDESSRQKVAFPKTEKNRAREKTR